jgi:hypothetical protein
MFGVLELRVAWEEGNCAPSLNCTLRSLGSARNISESTSCIPPHTWIYMTLMSSRD